MVSRKPKIIARPSASQPVWRREILHIRPGNYFCLCAYPSSKMCNKCHHIQPMPLSERVFICGECGYTVGRDLGAAINLKHATQEVVRQAMP